MDNIVLVSDKGEKMVRESDLIDVWFDSGAMPYAQVHYPFEIGDAEFEKVYPADYVAEGVDQTRGWFFTLHALATMLFDSVAFKNIISNGLVLDKNGNKMSKRLGNAVDPFEVLEKYRADAVRWYMISNSQPWDNLKFDVEGVDEVRRKFFGTLYNTYRLFRAVRQRGRIHRPRTGSAGRKTSRDRPLDHLAAEHAGQRGNGRARKLRSDAGGSRHPGIRRRKPVELVRAPEPKTFLGRRTFRR